MPVPSPDLPHPRAAWAIGPILSRDWRTLRGHEHGHGRQSRTAGFSKRRGLHRYTDVLYTSEDAIPKRLAGTRDRQGTGCVPPGRSRAARRAESPSLRARTSRPRRATGAGALRGEGTSVHGEPRPRAGGEAGARRSRVPAERPAFPRPHYAQPAEVWLALPEKARRPRLDYPRLRVARFSGAALSEGIEVHRIEGVDVRVYSAAKTVADCFKYRNKIGIDVAVEALKDFSRTRRGGANQLARFAPHLPCVTGDAAVPGRDRMKPPGPRNLAASVAARLREKSRRTGDRLPDPAGSLLL